MILLTIPVFVPMFAKLGLDLVWLGVLVVKYIGISLLTPPVGFNIYVVATATGNTIPLKTIYRGCYWFLACEVLIMTLLIAFPQISLWLPNAMKLSSSPLIPRERELASRRTARRWPHLGCPPSPAHLRSEAIQRPATRPSHRRTALPPRTPAG